MVFPAGGQLPPKGLTAGCGHGEDRSTLTLAAPSSSKMGPALSPAWSDVCCSVDIRKQERREGMGREKRSYPVSSGPVSGMASAFSFLALEDHPLGVTFWPPNRLFTEQGQRAERIPASSTPGPLSPGKG